MNTNTLLRFYRIPALNQDETDRLRREGGFDPGEIKTEFCLYVESPPLTPRQEKTLREIFAATYQPDSLASNSFLEGCPTVIEVGPRLNFMTVASSTTVQVLHDCGLKEVERVERSIRIGINQALTEDDIQRFLAPLFSKMIFDKMTQMRYPGPLVTFESGITPAPVLWIPVMEKGMRALKQVCGPKGMGLSFDEDDYNHVLEMFRRNPSDSEIFGIGQELSEHCSHARWNGKQIIDGVPAEHTLFELANLPWQTNPGNSLVVFEDEFSAFASLRPVRVLVPNDPTKPSVLFPGTVLLHPTLSDESHCHPSGVCPEEGAATGIARIRDNITGGRGGEMVCGWFGMALGNLCLPGYDLPWEEKGWKPLGVVAPLEIAIEGRNGAWRFGNALGEPCLGGWFITFGLDPGDNDYRSYFKPIVFTGGHSLVRQEHVKKNEVEKGMLLVIWGGPNLPVGFGGGSRSSTASSAEDDSSKTEELDFNSVQRGGPFMQQLGVRVVHGCIALGGRNPLERPKDLGAGGLWTAIAELAKNCGVDVAIREIPSGDVTMPVVVLSNNESQERHIAPIRPGKNLRLFAKIADRVGCPWAVIGHFTGDGQMVWHDSWAQGKDATPINLPLDELFAKRPQKTYHLETIDCEHRPLRLPQRLTMAQALERILRLPSVACKSWLTNHVDRTVGGRTVRQSCVGPYQLPAADNWIAATSTLDTLGTVMTSSLQPHAGLISPEAMARLTLAEMLLSISGAVISGIEDIFTEINWFSAVKEPGEGVVVERTARELAKRLIEFKGKQGGGKDSSSGEKMAISPQGKKVKVKWPVTTVVTAAVQMTEMTHYVTPVIEANSLVHVDLCPEKKPLGATALAQVYGQTGDDCADVNMARCISYFLITQELLKRDQIKSLHDISDGGLVTTILEMAFVSGRGLRINSHGRFGWLRHYFSQVPGVVICCDPQDQQNVLKRYREAGLWAQKIGHVQQRRKSTPPSIVIRHNNRIVLRQPMLKLRADWMETSFQLDSQRKNPKCVESERHVMATLLDYPPFRLACSYRCLKPIEIRHKDRPILANIVTAPGSNGDREMITAAYLAGFEPKDIITNDLKKGKAHMDDCQVALGVGGFSYQDEPLEAGIGWAATWRNNRHAWDQIKGFYFQRQDTLSYGACNAAQLELILGIVPDQTLPLERRPRFLRNESGMFESRFVAVKLLESPAVMFQTIERSIMGIIVAHREGRLFCPDPTVIDWILQNDLAPMRYVDYQGMITEEYPFNPNGSPHGIAGLCTPDGRHVVSMPHIERLFQKWQWPWLPKHFRRLAESPWLQVFKDMYAWCLEHRTS